MTDRPILLWVRSDLRLADNPALHAAAATGRPVIPVAILDEAAGALGAAAAWRLGQGLSSFDDRLRGIGSRLTLRRGPAGAVLDRLLAETGAGAVFWGRGYDPAFHDRDAAIRAGLRARGLEAQSFPGHLLFEPWTVATGQGGPYRVYSPFWRAVKDLPVAPPLPAPARLAPPPEWPASDRLADWALAARMHRGAAVVARHAQVGEDAAGARLARFLAGAVEDYREARDFPARPATSGLSENLTWGEISPRILWHAAQSAAAAGARGAEHFLKELVWREFAWHLLHHFPDLPRANWRREWDAFPWRPDNDDAERWRRGLTGEPFVDAGMRQMYVTGTMHNRLRMIVASYLAKHLLTDWRVGLAWFQDCLIDWDPAANAMGWQWVAGSGPDAAPYFRVFNPAGQAEKFDPDGRFRRAWIAEGQRNPPETARSFFEAVPRSWGLSPDHPCPAPLMDLAKGRDRALAAWHGLGRG